MLIFKTKDFAQWAKKMKTADSKFIKAISKIEHGLIDAELGNYLYKERVALQNSGKREGARTIIAYKDWDKAYFLYGFAKNEKDTISITEKYALKKYADVLINMSAKQLHNAKIGGEIIEVCYE